MSALLGIRSDPFTLALSCLTGLLAVIWAVLWLSVSLWVLASFLKSALRVAD